MREILFRGQTRRYGEKLLNVAGDKMPSNWVYGGICKGDGDKSIIYGSNSFPDLRPFDKHVVYTDTVGQYTGLTDKNGKRIFEGDILSEKPPMNNISFVGYVKYDTELAAFRIVFNNPDNVCILGSYSKSYTVIGNIHDNPELLEVNNE